MNNNGINEVIELLTKCMNNECKTCGHSGDYECCEDNLLKEAIEKLKSVRENSKHITLRDLLSIVADEDVVGIEACHHDGYYLDDGITTTKNSWFIRNILDRDVDYIHVRNKGNGAMLTFDIVVDDIEVDAK